MFDVLIFNCCGKTVRERKNRFQKHLDEDIFFLLEKQMPRKTNDTNRCVKTTKVLH